MERDTIIDRSGDTIYEFPMTNRIRSFLRYEHLLKRLSFLTEHGEPMCALQALHELIELTRYNDIRSELIQHLQWQEKHLQTFTGNETANIHEIDKLLQEKQKIIHALDSFSLPASYYLNHSFLNSVKLRFSVPAGTCNFDLPLLHAWLHAPPEHIHRDLLSWKKPFDTIQTGILNTLALSRMSTEFEKEIAPEGYYIKEFSGIDRLPTIMRIKLNTANLKYPEAVVGKRHFTIHFFNGNELEKSASKIQEDVSFELACCNL